MPGRNLLGECSGIDILTAQDNRFHTVTVAASIMFSQEICDGNAVTAPTACNYTNRAASGDGSIMLTAMSYGAWIKNGKAAITGGFFAGRSCCSDEVVFFFPASLNMGMGTYSDSSVDSGGSCCVLPQPPTCVGVAPPQVCTVPTDPGYSEISATLAIVYDSVAQTYTVQGGLCAPDYCANLRSGACQLIDESSYTGLCSADGSGRILDQGGLQITDLIDSSVEGTYTLPSSACANVTPYDGTHTGTIRTGTSTLTVTFA